MERRAAHLQYVAWLKCGESISANVDKACRRQTNNCKHLMVGIVRSNYRATLNERLDACLRQIFRNELLRNGIRIVALFGL